MGAVRSSSLPPPVTVVTSSAHYDVRFNSVQQILRRNTNLFDEEFLILSLGTLADTGDGGAANLSCSQRAPDSTPGIKISRQMSPKIQIDLDMAQISPPPPPPSFSRVGKSSSQSEQK